MQISNIIQIGNYYNAITQINNIANRYIRYSEYAIIKYYY